MEKLYDMDGVTPVENWPVERPKVTQMVIDTFAKVLDAQDEKGVKKYDRTIDDAEDSEYNWLLMALEELADYSKYQVKEIIKFKKEANYWRGMYELERKKRKQLEEKPAHDCNKNQIILWAAPNKVQSITCNVCNKNLFGSDQEWDE